MTYHRNIIKRIKDSDNWPGLERAEFLDKLNEVADAAFEKNSIEGYLAAVLIYHQLTEELLKIIIECSVFYIQLRVYPQEFHPKKSKRKMFGQIIQELKHGVIDDEIKMLIKKSEDLNSLRIKIVHKLTLKSSLGSIKTQCKKTKRQFDEIFELYDTIYDNYRVTFKDYRKYPEELEELIE